LEPVKRTTMLSATFFSMKISRSAP